MIEKNMEKHLKGNTNCKHLFEGELNIDLSRRKEKQSWDPFVKDVCLKMALFGRPVRKCPFFADSHAFLGVGFRNLFFQNFTL